MTNGDSSGRCDLCHAASSVTMEPPRRTLARGADPDDPSLSVIVILPDIMLCGDHASSRQWSSDMRG